MSGIIAQNTLDNSGLIKSPAAGGAWNFISKITASSDATVSFTSGIDSTYKLYLFTFKNIHLSTDSEPDFLVNFSIDSGSNYNVTKTSSAFYVRHAENDDWANLTYDGTVDMAQGTGNQLLSLNAEGADADASTSGFMYLWNPASTVFVKHYTIHIAYMHDYPAMWDQYQAGYCNTTSAIDAVRFYGEQGEGSASTIDSGDICLYGLTT